jgi:hypothetical protein
MSVEMVTGAVQGKCVGGEPVDKGSSDSTNACDAQVIHPRQRIENAAGATNRLPPETRDLGFL